MGREQLLDVTSRLVAWINTAKVDAASLLTMCAKEIVVPIAYPGSTPDFDGLISVTNNSHIAFPDFKMTVKDEIIDDKESRVVLLLNVTGTQAGYVFLSTSDCISEWLGIPGTGKRTDVQGFMYTKVSPLHNIF
jgi:hypothetical protein